MMVPMLRLKISVTCLCTMLFAVGCGKPTGGAATSDIESLIAANQLQSALEAIEARHKQEPADVSCLRLRVFVLLKAAQPADALLALSALPADDPVLVQALRHRDGAIRVAAARLIAERGLAVEAGELMRGLD